MASVEKYRHQFYRFLKRNLWDQSAVEDAFSSAVVAALTNRGGFTRGTNFRAWMFRILANKAFVANREKARTPAGLDGAEETLADLHEEPVYHDVLDDPAGFLDGCGDEVQRAFRRLSTAERMAFLLRAAEHMSYKEIARIMDIPVGTVMTHLARGRAKLRTDLVEYAEREGFLRRTPAKKRRRRTPELAGALA